MAFKREADSSEWLSLLRKRRIAELLSEDIPEDEAILMKNGRFCCTVCPRRPIFDTAEMLSHHRGGRKHSEARERQIDQKLEIQQIVQKRRHEKYTSGNSSQVSSSTTTSASSHKLHPLLTAQTYEPTVKKTRRVKPGQRKPIVDLEGVLEGAQTIAEFQRLKSAPQSESIVKPYSSKNVTMGAMKTSINVPRIVKASVKTPITNQDKPSDNFTIKSVTSTGEKQKGRNTVESDKSVVYVHPQNNKKSRTPVACTKVPPEGDTRKRTTAELYMKAREAGWKRSSDGLWTRDEDVEFDSDEEPPDLP